MGDTKPATNCRANEEKEAAEKKSFNNLKTDHLQGFS